MNFNFSSNNKPLSTYSLAGLTDIVLLLLVFFLLTSNFIPQFGIQVNLPQAETSAPMDDQYVSVAITADGQYYVNQNPVQREQLADALREAKGDRTALVLRADEEATVAQFALVANLARALDLRVLMATERGRP
ncbi:MAG: biopolymer transporter ExbD [Bacteroidetes bacterium SB0662_bin_6]|nr:biopolymer transporter ExbD [Bacteroidetes bacterium SB0668_bin_1]MYE05120.1 biopolymer transporter ExbD [Bacteroidetes bacterium SB0662_bin_6]